MTTILASGTEWKWYASGKSNTNPPRINETSWNSLQLVCLSQPKTLATRNYDQTMTKVPIMDGPSCKECPP